MNDYTVTCEAYVKDPSIISKLSSSSKIRFYRRVRDLYIEASRTQSEKSINLVKQVLETLPPCTSMIFTHIYSVSPFPSCVHTVICKRNLLLGAYRVKKVCDLYAYFKSNNNLEYLFISPSDLSYHNLQNVIDIDSQLRFILSSNFNLRARGPALAFSHVPGVWKLKLDNSCAPLLNLDAYDLYLKPIHKTNKDGHRVSINSPFLTEMINKLIINCEISELKTDFVSANDIIRYNKFPADSEENFNPINHNDSQVPIIKKMNDNDDINTNRERSKYVLLIYLTAPKTKHNRAALKFNDSTNLNITNPFTCIIYDHKLEVTGQPYVDIDQIFIRTELIYISKSYPPNKSKLFDISCYDIKESLYHEEFIVTVNDMFDRVNALRYLDCNQLSERYILKPPLYLNSIKDINFIIHEKNYYFLSNINIKLAVAIILLDYFSKKYNNFSKYNFEECRTSQELSNNNDFTIDQITKHLLSLAKNKPELLIKMDENLDVRIETNESVNINDGYVSNDNAETCISDDEGSDNNIISDDEVKTVEIKQETDTDVKTELQPEPEKIEEQPEPEPEPEKTEEPELQPEKIEEPELQPEKIEEQPENPTDDGEDEEDNDEDEDNEDNEDNEANEAKKNKKNKKCRNNEDILFAYEIDYNPAISSESLGSNEVPTWCERKLLEEKQSIERSLIKTSDIIVEEKCDVYKIPIDCVQKTKEDVTINLILEELGLLKNELTHKCDVDGIIKNTTEDLLNYSVIIANEILNINVDSIEVQDNYIKLSKSDSSSFDIITVPDVDIIAYKLPNITYNQYINLYEFSIKSFKEVIKNRVTQN